jgi:hypothetical protein
MSEDLPVSNERSDANYIRNMPNMAQTPKPDKMPPIGHFGPASVSKDSKKRRGGPGATTTTPSAVPEAPPPSKSNNNNNVQGGNPAKASSP